MKRNMEIALSKSLSAKEYHQMINEYYTNTYGLADVSTKLLVAASYNIFYF